MDIERIQSVSKPFVPSIVIKCIQMKLNANIYMFSFFKIRTKRTLKTLVLIGSLLLIATTSGDALRFSSAQEVAAPYSYDLITWHFENFLSKWTHRASRYLPWNYLSDAERQSLVAEYFELTPRMQELKDIIRTVSSEAGNDSGPRLAGLESELDLVRARREHLQPDVEDHQRRDFVLDRAHAFVGGAREPGGIALVAQDVRDQFANVALVVGNQDVAHLMPHAVACNAGCPVFSMSPDSP